MANAAAVSENLLVGARVTLEMSVVSRTYWCIRDPPY